MESGVAGAPPSMRCAAFEFVERHGHVWKIVHDPRAISAIAARPTAGVPSLTLSEPLSAKNTATFSGF